MKLRKLLVLLLLLTAAFILSACGKQGIQGETGDAGLKGETGAPGQKGPTGEAGNPGAKGEDGADGLGIQFSYGSEGITWKYIGGTEWNDGFAYADLFKFLESGKKVAFDYYVDPSLTLDEGAPLIACGNELVFGQTAFKTVGAALTAIKAASAEKGYKGAVLYLEAGVYEETIDVDFDGLTIKGANTGLTLEHDSTFDVDAKSNTVITKKITVTGKNTTLRGLVVKNQITVTAAENLTLKEIVLTANQSNGIVEFNGANKNFVSDKVYVLGPTGNRTFYIYGSVENFKVTRNVVLDSVSGLWDWIRVGSGTEGRLYGEVELSYNYLSKANQSGFMDRLPSASKYVIKYNEFHNAFATIYFRSGAAANIEVVIENNTFVECGGDPYWDAFAIYPNDTMKLSFNKNNFFDCKYASDYIVINITNDTGTVDCSNNFFNTDGQKTQVKNATGLTFAEAEFELPELPVDRFSDDKYEAIFDKLAAEFVEDFNATATLELSDASKIDTDHMSSTKLKTFMEDEEMYAKWYWLFSAIAELAEAPEKDPEAADFTWDSVLPFYFPNLCGLFTMTQHKDTWFETDSLDFSDTALVEAVLDAYEEPVDYVALRKALAAEFIDDFNTLCETELEDASEFNTDSFDSPAIVDFYNDEDMSAKWGWLFKALGELDEDFDVEGEDFDISEFDTKGYFISNICGLFTATKNEDPNFHTVSADFTVAANVEAVLSAYEG